jgi:lysophospholipase L1-like esterase
MLILSLALGCAGSTKQRDAAAPGPTDTSTSAPADVQGADVPGAGADLLPAGPDTGWRGVGPACNYVPTSGGLDAGGSVDGGWQEGAAWDWVGIVGTGQSLAVGDHGNPVKSTTQPYGNLKLATGTLAWPVDANDAKLTLVPLTEPVGRLARTYPSAWPENIAGETMHSSMGNQMTALSRATRNRDLVSVHGEFGENGQCMTYLHKGATPNGVNGRAFQATLIETQAITRLAAAAGKTYGVGAIALVHGECDSVNPTYEDDLVKLWTDYNTDLRAITGQAQKIPMLVSQQNSTSSHSASTLAQWKVGVHHPDDFVCVGPKYQYPSATDGTHLTVDGYRLLGEKMGQVFFERLVQGHDWQPLQPTGVERKGDRIISVKFHVPVLPLAWDADLQPPHQNSMLEWALGKGFEVRAGTKRLMITSADIVCSTGDTVEITMAEQLPATGVIVTYALYGESSPRSFPVTGAARWGLLRDSDPFVGSSTQQAQPNYAVAFELPVPDP